WRSLNRAGLLEGRVHVVKDQKYQIVSIGVWFEAGTICFKRSDAQCALGFNDFFAKLTPETREWWSKARRCSETLFR
ncbi:MAG: hypothetical protein NXY57DRAFT_908018, partial [Lentinula lateritia]